MMIGTTTSTMLYPAPGSVQAPPPVLPLEFFTQVPTLDSALVSSRASVSRLDVADISRGTNLLEPVRALQSGTLKKSFDASQQQEAMPSPGSKPSLHSGVSGYLQQSSQDFDKAKTVASAAAITNAITSTAHIVAQQPGPLGQQAGLVTSVLQNGHASQGVQAEQRMQHRSAWENAVASALAAVDSESPTQQQKPQPHAGPMQGMQSAPVSSQVATSEPAGTPGRVLTTSQSASGRRHSNPAHGLTVAVSHLQTQLASLRARQDRKSTPISAIQSSPVADNTTDPDSLLLPDSSMAATAAVTASGQVINLQPVVPVEELQKANLRRSTSTQRLSQPRTNPSTASTPMADSQPAGLPTIASESVSQQQACQGEDDSGSVPSPTAATASGDRAERRRALMRQASRRGAYPEFSGPPKPIGNSLSSFMLDQQYMPIDVPQKPQAKKQPRPSQASGVDTASSNGAVGLLKGLVSVFQKDTNGKGKSVFKKRSADLEANAITVSGPREPTYYAAPTIQHQPMQRNQPPSGTPASPPMGMPMMGASDANSTAAHAGSQEPSLISTTSPVSRIGAGNEGFEYGHNVLPDNAHTDAVTPVTPGSINWLDSAMFKSHPLITPNSGLYSLASTAEQTQQTSTQLFTSAAAAVITGGSNSVHGGSAWLRVSGDEGSAQKFRVTPRIPVGIMSDNNLASLATQQAEQPDRLGNPVVRESWQPSTAGSRGGLVLFRKRKPVITHDMTQLPTGTGVNTVSTAQESEIRTQAAGSEAGVLAFWLLVVFSLWAVLTCFRCLFSSSTINHHRV